MSAVHCVRLAPHGPTRVLDNHDVDAVVLEFDAATGAFSDFRLELGRGYFVVWVLPIQRGGRLRSILVDCAVAHVDMEVEQDPCALTLGPWHWSGALGKVGPDRAFTVEEVHIELTEAPAGYRCEVRTRTPDGIVVSDKTASPS